MPRYSTDADHGLALIAVCIVVVIYGWLGWELVKWVWEAVTGALQ